MTIQKIHMDYHRNGVMGVGFYVILFHWKDVEARKTRQMLATVFPHPGMVAVLDVNETAQAHLTFEEGNRWRGDDFEPALRALIAEYETETYGTHSIFGVSHKETHDTHRACDNPDHPSQW